ncbi:tyrosine-type recombinase/integrase [Ensifer sp. PDNC004]|uniref:tyrosine-type recombinase/integrase n=1 Tax=Ensifer sp. PDNC004 TaxID=2811423 RepID=UPI001963D166|nr:tyrosine-type recombinase/integrase [Ensifer sp. PDNC004]QRY69161.1 tyrosine-type recombinase/integrase [Ensifer sp. PDNC004]
MTDVVEIEYPYVERNVTRHGKARYYLRIDGKRICRLPNKIDSEEFQKEYWAARKAYQPDAAPDPAQPQTLSKIVKPNSFRWLCLEYMGSIAFKTLDVTTQDRRRNIIEAMWEEPLSTNDGRLFADMPLSAMDVGNLEVLRDRKKEKPFAADERLKTLRQVFDTKKDGKPIVANIARLVEPFRQQSDGHETATPENLAAFIAHHGVKSKAVLYLAIQMFTGLRVSDLRVIGPQHRRKDVFKLRLFKNRNRTPVDLEIAIHPILEGVLAMHPPKGLHYLVTEFGKPFNSAKSLGNRISDWWRQADMPHLTSHSVRKGLATDLAHEEATDSMLEAMFGWKDGKTSKIYTRNAERARLARQSVARINWDGIGNLLLASDDVGEGETGNGLPHLSESVAAGAIPLMK